MNSKDFESFDFIKSKFEAAEPDVPIMLGEKAVEYKILTKQKHKVIKFENKVNLKPLASVAACFILIFAILFSVNQFGDNADKALTFKSENELNSIVAGLEKWGMEGRGGTSDYQEIYTEKDFAGCRRSAVSNGKYIFYVYSDYRRAKDEGKIYIFNAAGETAELIDIMNIDLPKDDYSVDSIYAAENNLLVNLSNHYETVSRIYDVTNPKAPKQLKELSQSGMHVNSYRLDDTVYIVSNYCVENDISNTYIPKNDGEAIKAKNIYRFEELIAANYMVIGAIDIKSVKRADETKAILGAYYETYISDSHLYVTSDYDQNANEDGFNYIEYNFESGKATFAVPQILDIPKESEYEKQKLVKINENRIVLVRESAALDGDEIILYDISDKEKPAEIDRKKLDGISVSKTALNYKNERFAVPFYRADETRRYYGILTFEVQNDKIEVIKDSVKDDDSFMAGGDCIFVKDYVYCFDINLDAPDKEKFTVFSYKLN